MDRQLRETHSVHGQSNPEKDFYYIPETNGCCSVGTLRSQFVTSNTDTEERAPKYRLRSPCGQN